MKTMGGFGSADPCRLEDLDLAMARCCSSSQHTGRRGLEATISKLVIGPWAVKGQVMEWPCRMIWELKKLIRALHG